eukprot:PhF_6_TR36134/c1_g1_i1/m.52480
MPKKGNHTAQDHRFTNLMRQTEENIVRTVVKGKGTLQPKMTLTKEVAAKEVEMRKRKEGKSRQDIIAATVGRKAIVDITRVVGRKKVKSLQDTANLLGEDQNN